MQIIRPLRSRILIRKDDDKERTKGGILLPADSKVPVITGRVVQISPDLEHDLDFPVNLYDKVIVNPAKAIPVDFESDNKLYIIPANDVIGVYVNEESKDPEPSHGMFDLS